MWRVLAVLVALTFVASAMAQQAPRCWRNAEGVMECGMRPPPGVDARDVRVQRAPAEDPAVREAEAFGEADPDEEERTRLAIQQRQCDLARETLAAYERSEFLYERDPQGNRRVLDEAETEQARADARRSVELSCAGLPEPDAA